MNDRVRIGVISFMMVVVFAVAAAYCFVSFEKNQTAVDEYHRVSSLNAYMGNAERALVKALSATDAFLVTLDQSNISMAVRFYGDATDGVWAAFGLVRADSVRAGLDELLKGISASSTALIAVHDDFTVLDKYYTEKIGRVASVFADQLEKYSGASGSDAAISARLWSNFASIRSLMARLDVLPSAEDASKAMAQLDEMQSDLKNLSGKTDSGELKKLEEVFSFFKNICVEFDELAKKAERSRANMDNASRNARNLAEKLSSEMAEKSKQFSMHVFYELDESKKRMMTTGAVGIGLNVLLAVFLVASVKAGTSGTRAYSQGQARTPNATQAQNNPQSTDDTVRAMAELSRNIAGASEVLARVAEGLRRG